MHPLGANNSQTYPRGEYQNKTHPCHGGCGGEDGVAVGMVLRGWCRGWRLWCRYGGGATVVVTQGRVAAAIGVDEGGVAARGGVWCRGSIRSGSPENFSGGGRWWWLAGGGGGRPAGGVAGNS
nr:hypothetical protein [Tanacetum cinerariifolium]